MKQNHISNSLNTIAQIHCSYIKVCVKYMISVIYAYWRHMEADIWFNPGWDEGFNPFSDPMINFSSKGVVDIHLRSFPWEVFQNLIHNMCSEMIIFKIAYRNNNNLYECNCTRLNCEHLMSITLLLVNNSHGIANVNFVDLKEYFNVLPKHQVCLTRGQQCVCFFFKSDCAYCNTGSMGVISL